MKTSRTGLLSRRPWNLNLARSILLASLVGIVLVIALGLAVGRSQWHQATDSAVSQAKSTAFFLSQHAEQLFTVADLALQKAEQVANGADWAAIQSSRAAHDRLVTIRNDIRYIDDLWLNDTFGKLRSTSFSFPTPTSNAFDRDAFQAQLRADAGLFVGGSITGRVSSEETFLVSRRITDSQGEFAGVAFATVDLGYFNDFWQQLTLPEGMRVTILRAGDMGVLTSWPRTATGVSDSEAFASQVRAAGDAGETQFAEDGDIRFGSYEQVGDRAVYVRVTQSSNALKDAFWKRVRPLILFAVLGLLPLAGLTAVAWRLAMSGDDLRRQLDKEVRERTADLSAEKRTLDTLNGTGMTLAAKLDQDAIVQTVVDSATELSGARFGAFFYLRARNDGEHLRLHVLSGAALEDFADFGDPRETAVFAPTFVGNQVIRSADITRDPRYGRGVEGDEAQAAAGKGQSHAHGGMPKGHLPVRSYLAVPVVNREGKAHGAILLGHPEAGRFSERHQDLITGLAAQGAIALDNASLFEEAQREIAARRMAEDDQRILIDELNHRVKNMLATIKAVLRLSSRSASDVATFTESFINRLSSLAATHTILTEGMRQSADLRQLIENEIAPFVVVEGAGNEIVASDTRVALDGQSFELPANIAVPLGMGIHELVTNAVKYGALSVRSGRLTIQWSVTSEEEFDFLELRWRERHGPAVSLPARMGFGSQLLQRVLVDQIGARCVFDYESAGLTATITVRVPKPVSRSQSRANDAAVAGDQDASQGERRFAAR